MDTAVVATTSKNGAKRAPVAVKPAPGSDIVDTAKADASASASSQTAAAMATRDRSPVAATGQTLTGPSDTGVQATGAIHPQLPPATSTTAPLGSLSVTPPTAAP